MDTLSPTPRQVALWIDDRWQGQYDRLELWRSELGRQGPYTCLHADRWEPARLPEDEAGLEGQGATNPVLLSGKQLLLRVNNTYDVTLSFSRTDPYTLAQAAEDAAAQAGALLVAAVRGGQLVLETQTRGLAASLEVVGGAAAPALGLSLVRPLSLAFGRDARMMLAPGRTPYVVIDPRGGPHVTYKTRFYDSKSGGVSAYSLPFEALDEALGGLLPSTLLRATLDLITVEGTALAHEEVLLETVFDGHRVAGHTVAGGPRRLRTDAHGHLELWLVRGSRIRLAVGSTSLARELVVPVDPAVQTLDLLGPGAGPDDAFRVQPFRVSYAVRRSV